MSLSEHEQKAAIDAVRGELDPEGEEDPKKASMRAQLRLCLLKQAQTLPDELRDKLVHMTATQVEAVFVGQGRLFVYLFICS